MQFVADLRRALARSYLGLPERCILLRAGLHRDRLFIPAASLFLHHVLDTIVTTLQPLCASLPEIPVEISCIPAPVRARQRPP